MIQRKQHERLTTHAELEHLAQFRIREDLIAKTIAGDALGLQHDLTELAQEATKEGRSRPRGSAQVRDDRGSTLLALAAQYGNVDVAQFLLTFWKTMEPEEESMLIRTFKVNVNSRDAKGWTPVAIAVFHHSKQVLKLLLDHGADPTLRNEYHKNAIDMCQDELDAAGNVMKRHEEVLQVIQEWQTQRLSTVAFKKEPCIILDISPSQQKISKNGKSKKQAGKKKKK